MNAAPKIDFRTSSSGPARKLGEQNLHYGTNFVLKAAVTRNDIETFAHDRNTG